MSRPQALHEPPGRFEQLVHPSRRHRAHPLTEGTSRSPNGLGYPRIPGAYSEAQTAGWRKVVEAAHAGGARIFLQLMHVGRIGHPLNLPEGAELVAPSAIVAAGGMYTDQEGPQPHPTPKAMTADDVERNEVLPTNGKRPREGP